MKYTEHLVNTFYSSSHTGSISSADVTQKVINKETGDAVKIYMVINNGIIEDAKFQACGSVVLFASLSAIMDIIIGKPIEESLAVNEKLVLREIKQVNRCDYAMVSFAVRALNLTINSYLKKLNKLGSEPANKKPAKVRSYTASSQITVFSEGKDLTEEIEELMESSKEQKNIETATEKNADIVEEAEVEETDAVPELEDIEEELSPVEIKSKAELFESVPTKIEVRILEEEQKIEVVEVKDDVVIENETIEQKPEQNDDVIDEIDSITAKLTDAITKLNFKFDVDDSTEE